MTRIEIDGDRATVFGPIPFLLVQQIAQCSGRKRWNGSKSVSLEASGANMRILKSGVCPLRIVDKARPKAAKGIAKERTHYSPKITLQWYQDEAVAAAQKHEAFAFFMDPGLGKTATALTDAGILYKRGEISGVFIVAPNGVHDQWVEDEIPKHLDASIKVNVLQWGKNCKSDKDVIVRTNALNIFAINIEAIRSARGNPACRDFIEECGGRIAMYVDESHRIAAPDVEQHKCAVSLGKLCAYRRILTGTPMRKTAVDLYGQFAFLDKRIIGHNYVTSFRSHYCIMGGYENRVVVGHRNLEELFALIDPYCYRMTKDKAKLKLPEKIRAPYSEYKPSAATMRHYRELKKELITQLDDGTIASVPNAAAALIRMQQVVCGYVVDENGDEKDISGERLRHLMEVIDGTQGQAIIWARFKRDVKAVAGAIDKRYGKASARTYFGETKKRERTIIRSDFRAGKFRFLVGNAAAGGTGLDLPNTAHTVIYYSSDYSAVSRWQSEDRTHRVNSTRDVTYIDIVAKGTHDAAILRNIAKKKELLDAFMSKKGLTGSAAIEAFAKAGGDRLTLQDLRGMLNG